MPKVTESVLGGLPHYSKLQYGHLDLLWWGSSLSFRFDSGVSFLPRPPPWTTALPQPMLTRWVSEQGRDSRIQVLSLAPVWPWVSCLPLLACFLRSQCYPNQSLMATVPPLSEPSQSTPKTIPTAIYSHHYHISSYTHISKGKGGMESPINSHLTSTSSYLLLSVLLAMGGHSQLATHAAKWPRGLCEVRDPGSCPEGKSNQDQGWTGAEGTGKKPSNPGP